MNKIHPLRLSGVIMLLAGLAPAAHAAIVSASTGIFGIGGSANLVLSNDFYFADASTPFESQFDAGSTLPSWTFTTTQGGNTSHAALGPTFGGAEPTTEAGAIHSGSGSATVQWSFDWTASGSGAAFIDVDYLYSVTLQGLAGGESALASSYISVLRDGTSQRSEALHYLNQAAGNDFDEGHLLLPFDVLAGDWGSFTITLASNALAAPVPEPGTLLLMGAGVVGMGVVRRRRRHLA